MSVGRSVGWSATSYFFGLLGATNALYTALFNLILEAEIWAYLWGFEGSNRGLKNKQKFVV